MMNGDFKLILNVPIFVILEMNFPEENCMVQTLNVEIGKTFYRIVSSTPPTPLPASHRVKKEKKELLLWPLRVQWIKKVLVGVLTCCSCSQIIAGDPDGVTETSLSNVYSFGMVIWEMVTGEIAYSAYSPVQAAVGIAACGMRPDIPKDCPQILRSLMTKCWNNYPPKRPQFSEILMTLARSINNSHDSSRWWVFFIFVLPNLAKSNVFVKFIHFLKYLIQEASLFFFFLVRIEV